VTATQRRPTTTDAPVASDGHSLSVGPEDPILLQDYYLIEQMANFNRERIPERQPHAKASRSTRPRSSTGACAPAPPPHLVPEHTP
jgi:Catalase